MPQQKGGARTLYNVLESDKEIISYPKINHEKLGYYTFFSVHPISGLREIEDKEIEDKEIEDKGIEDKEIEDKGIEDKGIEDKGIEDKGISLSRFLVFADDTTIKMLKVEKDETDKLENLYTVDPELLEKYTCITFFDEDIQLWCVKSQEYFIELY